MIPSRSSRSFCWLTGLVGAGAMALLSPFLSQWTFGSDEHVFDIALLGLVILMGNLDGLVLLGLTFLPWAVPLVTMKPQVAAFAMLAKKSSAILFSGGLEFQLGP